MKYIISGITTLLAVVWIYMGYLGWTWIPVGRIPQKGQTRVACVGDSITYGALIRNWYRWNYPHQLQLILGSKYCVHNYGMSDRTGMETGNHPYVKEYRFKRSLRFCPDHVLLMFRTNDSKEINWRGAEEFKRQYEKLLCSYLELPSRPTVWIMLPAVPHHLDGKEGNEYCFGIRLSEIKEECVTLKELAEQYSLPVIDIYSFTEGHPEWFCRDGIYPNAEGSRKIAEYIGNRLLAS